MNSELLLLTLLHSYIRFLMVDKYEGCYISWGFWNKAWE